MEYFSDSDVLYNSSLDEPKFCILCRQRKRYHGDFVQRVRTGREWHVLLAGECNKCRRDGFLLRSVFLLDTANRAVTAVAGFASEQRYRYFYQSDSQLECLAGSDELLVGGFDSGRFLSPHRVSIRHNSYVIQCQWAAREHAILLARKRREYSRGRVILECVFIYNGNCATSTDVGFACKWSSRGCCESDVGLECVDWGNELFASDIDGC